MRPLAIVDYGMGNLRSVQKAFERLGHAAEVTRDADRIADAARLDEERLGRGRRRERGAQAVDDGPALGPQDQRAGVLALGELGQLTVLDDHQPGETTREASEREGENGREDEDPRADGRIPHGAGGLGAAIDAARLRSAATPVPPATYSFASRT